MSVIPLRVLLFVAGALVAALGTAYFAGGLDPYLGRVAPETADVDRASPAAPQEETASAGGTAGPEAAKETGASDISRKTSGEEEEIVVPTFDVVRVEPDGSIVVAGAAEPGSQVELVEGATVLGMAEAGPGGDFAIVLDKPLDPGDYQIVLRSTASENVAATSVETAVVSVPDSEDGQVLALVEQPGQPSRLITKPQPPAEETQVATAEDAKPDTAAPPQDVSTAEDAASAGGEQAEADISQEHPSQLPTKTGEAGDAREQAQAPAGEKTSEAAPAPTGTDRQEETARDTVADGGEPPATAGGESAPAMEEGEDVAAASGETSVQPAQAAKPAEEKEDAAELFIEAVEIDGRQVFVAGVAESGSRVRVYANDILLGEATASPNGRFLVEARRDLPQGDYIVRADMLSEDGAAVTARAAVPFAREAGEKIAAVAPKQQQRPSGPALAAADTDQPAVADEQGRSAAGMPAAGTPASAASPAKTDAQASAAAVDPNAPASATDTDARSTQPADQATGQEASPPVAAASGDADSEADAVTAPKLEPVDGAVIIRRGDTLWHISRRVYGRGIRYTTIYLANQDQIRDPDLIWPGQVFAVPEKTEEGEPADMSAIGEQAVPMPDDERETGD